MPIKNRRIPTRDVEFQVDTIPQGAGYNGVFIPKRNAVEISYKNGKTYTDTLPHEQKHKDNEIAGLYEYPVSPEQAYKIYMHDEISANIASLIVLRQKYLETGDISVFDYNGGDDRYKFYKEAIEKGEINPRSEYKEDFNKEMALIANGTRNMWEDEFAQVYNKSSLSCAKFSSDKDGKYAEYHDKNYKRALKIAYNIGGVDFSEYMNRDAEIPEIGKKGIADYMADYKEKNKINEMSSQQIVEKFGVPKFNGDMSLEQYQKLVQHKLAMDEFLDNRVWQEDTNEKYIEEICLQKILYDEPDYVNLRNTIKETLGTYKYIYTLAQNNVDQKIVDAAVNSVAREYAQRGEELPKVNEKAYNDAVNQIYTYNVEFNNNKRNVCLKETLVDDSLIKTNLPQYAKSVQDNAGWKSKLYNVFNKGKNFIFSYGEKVKNEPVNDVNRSAPKYRQWEDKDGSRVSEVQYAELPDLTRTVIKKPTKSYSESMQKGHAKIAEMRAKRAAGHEEISSSSQDENPMAARLRELRFEKSQRTSGSITPTRINALHLANLLERSVNN
ncbi:MAG: hypothetical protein J6K16_05535 [Alphaproteobacteria bacterium]|nr:hypothetical protein [Alphaproteobacteria bacterium]